MSGLAGPWNRGIIAHQTPHFRRPPKHVNNKGPLVFAQTFCTAWFISLENLHIYSKTYVFSNTFEGFRPKCTFGGCWSKYRRTFIVYMFRRPPEVWSLMSDNALISGTGKLLALLPAQAPSQNCCWGTFTCLKMSAASNELFGMHWNSTINVRNISHASLWFSHLFHAHDTYLSRWHTKLNKFCKQNTHSPTGSAIRFHKMMCAHLTKCFTIPLCKDIGMYISKSLCALPKIFQNITYPFK